MTGGGRNQADLPWQARLPFYYGYAIVGVVFLQSFVSSAPLWSTGVLSVPMQDELGWGRSSIFAGITMRTLGAAASGLLLGRYLDVSGGARTLALISGFFAALGLCLVAFVQEAWQFMLIFGVFGGLLGAGPSSLLLGAIVPKWFIRQRGRAVATSTMGTGLAAFVLPVLVNLMAHSFDWRWAWVILGVMTGVFSVLPALLLKTQPEDLGLRPDGETDARVPAGAVTSASPASRQAEVNFTAGEAWRTSTLWLLIAVVVFGSVSPTAFPVNLVQVYVERGFSATTAAAAFSGYGLASFLGRFFWGFLADRLHIRQTLLVISAYCGIALAMLLVLPGNSALAAGAIAGLGIGGWVGLNQVIWADYFGRSHLGAISGITRPFITISSATGPLYIAALADLSGSYSLSMVVMATSWWFCALLLLIVRPAKRPASLEALAPA
ncbi:MAG TPA: MFS transporter [Dehalococcoidia bacterium]|nr:MFS transporter [Dehalococcoidia bacterium]